MKLSAAEFGDHFTWGVASAAYQTEGAYLADGKGLSIWDVFTATKGKIARGENGNTACDFYNRFLQDIILMHSLGIKAFRFSISWSRIFPQGAGMPNADGVSFYNQVIDFCLEMDIEPWITLYHWDLPQALQQKGGWCNRDIVSWFGDYVTFCVQEFGDRAKHWMVLNEPLVFTGAGHFLGIHAPGIKRLKSFLAAAHHAALCQVAGGRIIKSVRPDCKAGTTFSCSQVDAFSDKEDDRSAAIKIDAILNRLFIEPLLGLGYPLAEAKFLEGITAFFRPGDEAALAFDMDFIGLQNYTREVVRHTYLRPVINAQIVEADKRGVATTEMNWEVYPAGIYNMLKRYAAYPGIRELVVSENGAAFPDVLTGTAIHDAQRVSYLERYIAQVLKAKEEGVPVTGYFVWSFTDNFEWAEGYRPRFGLVHVDYKTQRRTIKDSGHWYRDFVRDKKRLPLLVPRA